MMGFYFYTSIIFSIPTTMCTTTYINTTRNTNTQLNTGEISHSYENKPPRAYH